MAHTITMYQRSYVEEVLERFGMEGCKHVRTLLKVKTPLVKLSGEEYEEFSREMKGGTLDVRLHIGGSNITLEGYSDTNWAGDLEYQKSIYGYIFFVGEGVILWNCK